VGEVTSIAYFENRGYFKRLINAKCAEKVVSKKCANFKDQKSCVKIQEETLTFDDLSNFHLDG
jgi:hypothetical protein